MQAVTTDQQKPFPIRGELLVLLSAVLWGTTGTAQALAPEAATPVAIGALRLLLGGTGLLAIAWWQGAILPWREWLRLPALVGGLFIGLYQLSFFAGVDRTGIAVGTVVAIGSAPISAGLLTLVIERKIPSPQWMLATFLAIIGCALLVLSGDEAVVIDWVGVLLSLGAGASYAIYAQMSKLMLKDHKPDAVMATICFLGALFLFPLLYGVDLSWLAEPNGALVVLHLGLVAVALAYALFGRGLMTVAASTAVTLSLAEPLTASLLGVFLIGEEITLWAAVGMALLLAGLAVLSFGKQKEGA